MLATSHDPVQHTPEHRHGGRTLLTAYEVSVLLGAPVPHVRRAVAAGELPVVWLGPEPYVDREALIGQLRLRRARASAGRAA